MYGLTPYSTGAIGASSALATEEAKPLGPNHYGAVAFGDIGEFLGLGVSGVYGTVSVTLALPVVAATLVHGIAGSCAATLAPVVMLGADQTERVATVVVEAGLSFSATSTIPTYAVGLIAPVVSVSASAWTTVRGTAEIVIPVSTTILGMQHMPIAANIVAKVRLSATIYVEPVATADIRPIVSVSGNGLVVTHGRGAVTIPTYVSSAVVTGFTGVVSATIQSVFSATASHSKTGTAAITVPVSFASTLNHGREIVGAISPSVVFYAMAGAYSDIQISGAISVPLYPYIRCTFGDDLLDADCVYVLTKQLSVSVLQ